MALLYKEALPAKIRIRESSLMLC